MTRFITSDPHFDHDNLRRLCQTRAHFKNVTEMNETIIKNWNSVVTNNDTVYLLGDIGLGRPEIIFAWLVQLKGIIYIVKGNHDNNKLLKYIIKHSPLLHGEPKFRVIEMGTIIKVSGIQYYLTHYPQGLGQQRPNLRNLCGHIHETPAHDANVLNVGMDSPEIRQRPFGSPIPLDDAMVYVNAKWTKWREKKERNEQ